MRSLKENSQGSQAANLSSFPDGENARERRKCKREGKGHVLRVKLPQGLGSRQPLGREEAF